MYTHLFSKQLSVGIILEEEKWGILFKNTVSHLWREKHQCTWSPSKSETTRSNTCFFPMHVGSASRLGNPGRESSFLCFSFFFFFFF